MRWGEELKREAKGSIIYESRALRGWDGVDLNAGVKELASGRKKEEGYHLLWDGMEWKQVLVTL